MLTARLLSPLEIKNNLDAIISELSRADDDSLKVEDIKDDLLIGEYDIYLVEIDGEHKYYMLCTVLHKTYFIMRVAGVGKLFPWDKLYEIVIPIVKSKDCVSITFSGSIAWEKKLKHLGFEIKEYTYSLGV